MGPWIILDKCVMQSLSKRAVYELSRYFNSNITPVLLLETLADLTCDPDDPHESAKKVRIIAGKAGPINAYPNLDYRQLCHNDLLGNIVPFARKVVKGGGQKVELPNGEYGIVFGVSPENEALMRWQSGLFTESDVTFAKGWRARIEAANLEERQREHGKKWKQKLGSLEEVKTAVDATMATPRLQEWCLQYAMTFLNLPPESHALIKSRWKQGGFVSFRRFAPYAFYCTRIQMLFEVGLANRMFGTKKSNIVDLEYLYYIPFCEVFSTKDDFLESFAKLVIEPDQTFVHGDQLRNELRYLGMMRFGTGEDGSYPLGWTTPFIEPDENSIIRLLHIKHRGKFIPQAQPSRPRSLEEDKRMMEQLKPIMEAMNKAIESRPPNQHWPSSQ